MMNTALVDIGGPVKFGKWIEIHLILIIITPQQQICSKAGKPLCNVVKCLLWSWWVGTRERVIKITLASHWTFCLPIQDLLPPSLYLFVFNPRRHQQAWQCRHLGTVHHRVTDTFPPRVIGPTLAYKSAKRASSWDLISICRLKYILPHLAL